MPESRVNPLLPRILLVDDEDQFRAALRRSLELRGFEVAEAGNGMRALALAREREPEVVILDERMPGMDGLETLTELKKIRPRAQVIMLTGHNRNGLSEAAKDRGLSHFLEKPCGIEELLATIAAADESRVRAATVAPSREKFNLRKWLIGVHGRRPGMIALGLLLFGAAFLLPGLVPGNTGGVLFTWIQARVGLGALALVVALLATGALPVGIIGLVGLAAVSLALAPDWGRAASLAARPEAVFFFSALAVAAAANRAGLDRRLGSWILWMARGRAAYLFLFLPLFAVAGAFFPEQGLVAALAPAVLALYDGSLRGRGLREDRGLAVTLLLGLAFAANLGALGTPLGGGRNLIAMTLSAVEGFSFAEWASRGLPLTVALCLPVSAYLYFALGRKSRVVALAAEEEARLRLDSLGRMKGRDWFVIVVIAALLAVWTLLPDRLGLAAPALAAVVILHLGGALRWKDLQSMHWDLVLLYAGLMAVAALVRETGVVAGLAGLVPADLPAAAYSALAALAANLVGPAGAVAALGPAAAERGASPLMATAFGAALAHAAVFATPANAIVYLLGKDPATGERLVTGKDFLIHGSVVLALNLATLWLLAALGWRP